MLDTFYAYDTWDPSIPKLPKASKIELDPIFGVLPFDGVRNPSARSASSHKVFMTYATEANNWQPKVGIGESGAEIAVALQAMISPDLYDLQFQPETVHYKDEDRVKRSYTHDILITFRNNHRRLVFVRNDNSLSKPKTERQIAAITAATSKQSAHDLIVVNASDFSRQRRENLFRMHTLVCNPDPEADELVFDAATRLKTLWQMKDLFLYAPLAQWRTFQACYRLVARGQLFTNLDNVFWEHSRISVQK